MQAETPILVTERQVVAGHRPWLVRSAFRLARNRMLIGGQLDGLRSGDEVVLLTPVGEQRREVDVWTDGNVVLAAVEVHDVAGGDDCWVCSADGHYRARLPKVGHELAAMLRDGPSALGAEARAAIIEFLVRVSAQTSPTLPRPLAESLYAARQMLRPRLSPGVVSADGERSLKIEVVGRVDESSAYLRGWIGYPSAALASVIAVSPEGARVELLPSLYRHQRNDVAHFYGEDSDDDGYGFAALVQLPVPNVLATGWVLEVVPIDGVPIEATAGDALTDPLAARNLLVGDLVIEKGSEELLRSNHLGPAITRALDAAQRRVEVVRVIQFGEPPPAPEVTIIVPLYRRVDLVDHQLANFADDPEIAHADLLYVLDSPELEEAFVADAHRLFRFYRVPFRLAVLSRNGGFSTANNRGASLARGRLLLLMNSDVMPDGPGWIHRLVDFYDRTPRIGALGMKLIYEDESIQHAGMYFARAAGATQWGNEHYCKGLHRTFAPACVTRRVPAVTAACMMIATDLYLKHGGLRGTYVQGDFEDSDLCLRLSRAGHEHWYVADVELYHLEGQSYPTWQRVANGEYNRWLHTHLWDEQIQHEMNKEIYA